MQEDFTNTFSRYIPKSEVDEFKADLVARTKPGTGGDGRWESVRALEREGSQGEGLRGLRLSLHSAFPLW